MNEIKIFNENFNIETESDLILLLININKHGGKNKNIIIWNLIMELDSKLEEIIITNNGLINILKRLDEKRSLLILTKLSDTLPFIIENTEKLGELLAKFSSNVGYKTQIIKSLRGRGLKFLIRNAEDFQNTVEWLFSKAEDKVFELLEDDFISNIFSSITEISSVLYYLTDKNKILFIDILGINNLKNKIFTYKDLSNICKILPGKYLIVLLETIGRKNILKLFSFERDFYNFLLSIPQSKENIFLTFLRK